MFSLAKSFAAVLALVSFAQATITIATPNLKGNTTNTITWTSSDATTDPETFSIELINQVFNSQFALGNNIPTTDGSFTFQMPVVSAGSGYTIEFVNIGNINDIFATSAPFSVQENDVSSTVSGSSASSGASSSQVASITTPLSSVGTLTQTGPSVTGTVPASFSSASLGSGASSAASSSASASASSAPSSAAMELIPSGSLAALVAGVVALLF